MSERVLSLLQKEGMYIAGVFSPYGLYTSSRPYNNKSDAIDAVDGKNLLRKDNAENIAALETVFAIYEGKRNAPIYDIKLDLTGFTKKQVAVLKVVMSIPFGSTMSYGAVAKRAGLPGAARFVGNVMRINRLGPVIPCHRVVSTTGLGGYTGGIDKKIELLAREGVIRGDFSQKALQGIP
ncbi:MAG: MGMT family protein [Candidatus Thorarchaeota archaeon]